MRSAKKHHRAAREHGFSLIEQIVGFAVTGILLALGLPNYADYIQNRHIRTAAESIVNGLQLARIEAVRRNDVVEFRGAGGDWSIVATGAGETVQTRSAAETSKAVVDITSGTVTAATIVVSFNGLGRITSGNAASTFDIPHTTGAAACGPTGSYRCLRVRMTSGGQVRMCDPQLASGDPQACS